MSHFPAIDPDAWHFDPASMNAKPRERPCPMRPFPFDDEWHDDFAIARHLATLRWGDDDGVPVCPHCQRPLWQSATKPRLFGCSHHPSFRRSVTADTFLHGTKLELWVLLHMIHLLLRDDAPSAAQLARTVAVNENTAYRWRQKIMLAVLRGGDPIVGVVEAASARVPTCGVQPDPPLPHPEALPEILAVYNRHAKRWPVWMFTDYDGEGMQGSSTPSLVDQLATHTGVDGTPWVDTTRGPARERVWLARNEIKYTHLGVSLRWMARYLQYIARRPQWRHPGDVLAELLGMPRMTFDELRPGGSPPHHVDARVLPHTQHLPVREMAGDRSHFYAGRRWPWRPGHAPAGASAPGYPGAKGVP